jgi:hypothetical protein
MMLFFPAISAVLLENFRQLVQCNLSAEVYALGNDRALKWRLSQVPRLKTISARISKLKHYGGKTPTEIHNSLMEVCGVETVDRSTISRWAQRFREGWLSIENDPKS